MGFKLKEKMIKIFSLFRKDKGLNGLVKKHLKKAKIIEHGSIVEIEYTMRRAKDFDDFIKKSLNEIKDTLKAVHDTQELKKYETIKFSGITRIKYKDGKKLKECVLEVMFDLENLESVSFDKMTLEQLLSLQEPYRISVSGVIRKELAEDTLILLYPGR